MKRLLYVFIVAAGVGIGVYLTVNSCFPEKAILALDRAGIVLGYLITCLSLGGAVTAYVSRGAIRNWLRNAVWRRSFEGIGMDFDPLREKLEAIVIPVSRREQPEWIMRHLKPEHIAFLFTDQSENAVQELVALASESQIRVVNGVNGTDAGPGLTGPDDPANARDVGRKLIDMFLRLGIDRRRIFVDTTGGRVPMSIGLFQAAEEAGVSSIYVIGKAKGGIIKDPANIKHGRPIFISDHTEDLQ